MHRTVVCAFLSATLVAGASVSSAAPKPAPAAPAAPIPAPPEIGVDEARYHFSQAVALYRDKNFNAALAEFQASYQLRPSAELLYNIGLTQKALFRYGEAIDSLTRYLAETKSASAERRAEVTQVIAEIRALLSEVSLDIHPEGATVSIDGRRVGQAPLAPFSLAAGYHVLEASAVDYESASKELTVVAGKPLALALTLKALPKTGLARIIPVPSLAMVRVDGKLVGTGDARARAHPRESPARGERAGLPAAAERDGDRPARTTHDQCRSRALAREAAAPPALVAVDGGRRGGGRRGHGHRGPARHPARGADRWDAWHGED